MANQIKVSFHTDKVTLMTEKNKKRCPFRDSVRLWSSKEIPELGAGRELPKVRAEGPWPMITLLIICLLLNSQLCISLICMYFKDLKEGMIRVHKLK